MFFSLISEIFSCSVRWPWNYLIQLGLILNFWLSCIHFSECWNNSICHYARFYRAHGLNWNFAHVCVLWWYLPMFECTSCESILTTFIYLFMCVHVHVPQCVCGSQGGIEKVCSHLLSHRFQNKLILPGLSPEHSHMLRHLSGSCFICLGWGLFWYLEFIILVILAGHGVLGITLFTTFLGNSVVTDTLPPFLNCMWTLEISTQDLLLMLQVLLYTEPSLLSFL